MTNLYGIYTLFKKEILRFAKVGVQTLCAPIISSLLYLLIFSNALQDKVNVYPGVSYIQFLVPGLIMMSIMQNAFANVSSSLIQSKVSGNIIFILLPPLSNIGFFIAFVGAALIRGLIVGLGIFLCSFIFEPTIPVHGLWAILFAVIGGTTLGSLGLIAGIVAEKFDQTALFQNFIIMPLTFLSGVFYSIQNLPDFWYKVSQVNPFFYLVDGFRYGFFGQADIQPSISLTVSLVFLILLASIAMLILKSGYKLKS
ncbi:metal-dependent hydrolase [Neisseriaceae bacterium PsAf]|nr:metal-dependent hydrolase [Neisseriaceae bacterium PsAf]MCV2502881.1 ABC transporter permease [Neisseriaceae bacterium]